MSIHEGLVSFAAFAAMQAEREKAQTENARLQNEIAEWKRVTRCGNSVAAVMLRTLIDQQEASLTAAEAQVAKLRDFVFAYDAWDDGDAQCGGELFDAMIEARDVLDGQFEVRSEVAGLGQILLPNGQTVLERVTTGEHALLPAPSEKTVTNE